MNCKPETCQVKKSLVWQPSMSPCFCLRLVKWKEHRWGVPAQNKTTNQTRVVCLMVVTNSHAIPAALDAAKWKVLHLILIKMQLISEQREFRSK